MSYQTFDGRPGASRSAEKWKALRLPRLTGMKVLDIGCNEGYFCNRVLEEGAAHAVGIDNNQEVIKDARKRFPKVEFHCQSWERLPAGPFDLILLLSAFHYAEDAEGLLELIRERLAPSGLFVLEIGMIAGRKDASWEKVRRPTGAVMFPTFPMVQKLLSGFAFKLKGESVMQSGDPCKRFVFHCHNLKPIIILVSGASGSGKTTLIRSLDLDDIHSVSLDQFLINLWTSGPKEFQNAIKNEYIPERLPEAFAAVRRAGLLNEFLNTLIESLPQTGVTFVEGVYVSQIESLLVWRLQTKGYVVWGACRKH